jgi:hypothetical protein
MVKDTTIVVSGVKENNNAMMGSMKNGTNA